MSRPLMNILIFTLFGIPGYHIFAQEQRMIQFTTENGLPTNYVYGVVEDDRGYIWAYTENGLARFDGYEFKNYSFKEGLPGNDIVWAQKGQDGKIWLWSYRHGATYLDGDSVRKLWDTPSYLTGLIDGKVTYSNGKNEIIVEEDPPFKILKLYDDSIMVNRPSLFQLEDVITPDEIESYNHTKINSLFFSSFHQDTLRIYRYISDPDIFGLRELPDGYFLYLSGESRVFWRRGERRKSFTVPPIPPDSWVPGLSTPKYQLGATESFLLKLGNQYLFLIDVEAECSSLIDLRSYGFTPKANTTIDVGKKTFTVSTDQGMLIFDFSGILQDKIPFPSLGEKYLPLRSYRDTRGNIWIGTREAGLFLLPQSARQTYRLSTEFPRDIAFEYVARTDQGDLIAISDNTGIYQIKGNNVTTLLAPRTNNRFKSATSVSSGILISSDKESYLLKIGKHGTSLESTDFAISEVKMEGVGRMTIPKRQEESYGRYINSEVMAYDPLRMFVYHSVGDARLLFRSIRLRNGKVMLEKFSLPITVGCLRYDEHQDRMLIGTPEGVFAFQGDTLQTLFSSSTELANISSLYPTETHCWIGTENNGLFAYSYAEKRVYQVSKALHIRNIRSYRDSTLLVASNEGLRIVSQANLQEIDKYGIANGLFSNEVWDVNFDGKHQIYVATGAGLHRIDLCQKQASTPALNRLKIMGMHVNGHSYPLKDEPTSLSYKQNSLAFHYQLLDPSLHGEIRYKRRLFPLEKDWEETSALNVSYLALPPGEYQFELSAEDYLGNTYTIPPTPFTIHKPFWQTYWFLTALSLLIIGIVSQAIYLRDRRIKRKLAEERRITRRLTELELSALKAQMNPHFVFNALGAIQYYIQTNERQVADTYLSQFALLMRKYLDSSKEKLIPLSEEISLLRLYTGLEKMRFEELFEVNIEIEDADFNYDELIPPMLIQPFVENAINHGLQERRDGKAQLTIRFSRKGHALVCEVRDNGIGRHKSRQARNKHHRSRGIQLIQSKVDTLRDAGIVDTRILIEDLSPEDEAFPGTHVTILITILEEDHV